MLRVTRAFLLLAAVGCAGRNQAAARPESEGHDLLAAVMDTIMGHAAFVDSLSGKPAGRSRICLSMIDIDRTDRPPDPRTVALMKSGARVVPLDACPHTYASMFGPVDSLGRRVSSIPLGHQDPHRIELGLPIYALRGTSWVYVKDQNGTGTREWWCRVVRAPSGIVVRCDNVRTSIS